MWHLGNLSDYLGFLALSDCLYVNLSLQSKYMTSIVFRINRNYKKILLTSVSYIETHPTKPHNLKIVTDIGIFNFVDNLNILERRYSDHIVRCHRICLE